MPGAPASRRFVLLLILAAAFLAFTFVASFRNQVQGTRHPANIGKQGITAEDEEIPSVSSLKGHAIAPKLGNETAKIMILMSPSAVYRAELGRAAWKLFHTTFARFPDKPTTDESTALQSYVYLFQRLYPCGECAEHFGTILDKFPPQVSSRSVAAAWGCHVHNEVNKSLNKELFDCSNIGDFYDCGCAEDEAGEGGEKAREVKSGALAGDDEPPVELKQEGYGRGG
ncbi:hypothetical protein B0A49_03227 [Cryomyces minteri]|uniref:Sulfhydryl oxidase n=1 Tax=Cryomyces minteri TaxID=331657 RepID=A0A4U0XIX8_9PEZI|nr:hypothetical protein B0A49_03227 [Cryomyces minteri]